MGFRQTALLAGLLSLASIALSWDPREGDVPWLENEIALFELTDRVHNKTNGTFYDLLQVAPNATSKELKVEYKRLAMIMHPDKNENENAEEEFGMLASVYNILRDKESRAMYDRILKEGLPDWRMPAFYDRQVQIVRKIGLLEGLVMLLLLASIVQYGMQWANYLERKITLAANEKKKRPEKKSKKTKKEDQSESSEEEENPLLGPKPSVYDTFPFQLYNLGKYCVDVAPTMPDYLRGLWEQYQKNKEEERREREEAEEQLRKKEERRAQKKDGRLRQRVAGEQ